MNESDKRDYVGYEYKEVTVPTEEVSFYLDSYENFGWSTDERFETGHSAHFTTIHLKRDRKIINKMELTRLQRHFEACAGEIKALEQSKTSAASVWAMMIGIIGTAFMAGSTFAVVHDPPIIWLCILLAIPGVIGWILPKFVYNRIVPKKTGEIQPLIEAKREEIYEICEKGHSLL